MTKQINYDEDMGNLHSLTFFKYSKDYIDAWLFVHVSFILLFLMEFTVLNIHEFICQCLYPKSIHKTLQL